MPARCSPSGSPAPTGGSSLRPAAAHRRQRLRPPGRRRRAGASNTARTSSTPTARKSAPICRGSPGGAPTSIACLQQHHRQAAADADQPHDPQRALRPRSFRRGGRRPRFWPPAPKSSIRDRDLPRRGRRPGRNQDLYRTFFEGYTRKQWGLDPSRARRIGDFPDADPDLARRSYFLDTYQAMPVNGFTRMFERMLAHRERQHARLRDDPRGLAHGAAAERTIYHRAHRRVFRPPLRRAPLPSLEFRLQTVDPQQHQPVAVINYPFEEVPTRESPNSSISRGRVIAKTTISTK